MPNWRTTVGLLERVGMLLCIGLIGCSSKNSPPAPIITLQPDTITETGKMNAAGEQYQVQVGDTLFRVAQVTGCNLQQLALQNQIPAPYLIYPGQILQVSGAYCLATTTAPQNATITTIDKNNNKINFINSKNNINDYNKIVNDKKTALLPHLTTDTAIPEVTAPVSDLSNHQITHWYWPTNGKLINSFSAADGGNKGIDLAGKRGQPIYSSAAGRVVYAGNALRGYGNLLIIKHNEEYLSAYAHNDTLFVREQQIVSAGQKIATMGNTGTRSFHLHFEIRYKGKSVNPLRYLPQR